MMNKDLMLQIELLRNKMIEVAKNEGFTHNNTICLSQELDRLLNDYENRNKNKCDNQEE